MIRIFLLLLLSISSSLAADELSHQDLVSIWKSDHPMTQGETSTLSFAADMSARFTREFGGRSPSQQHVAGSDQVSFLDDLIIVQLNHDKYGGSYKLVLSGWKGGSDKALFGTLYMYREGALFNGLPISFRKMR